MTFVSGVAMPVMDVVEMVPVGDRLVAATVPVVVVMAVMGDMRLELALVPVAIVLTVRMAIVQVVGVIAMLDGHVTAAGAVAMIVPAMDLMDRAHPASSH